MTDDTAEVEVVAIVRVPRRYLDDVDITPAMRKYLPPYLDIKSALVKGKVG